MPLDSGEHHFVIRYTGRLGDEFRGRARHSLLESVGTDTGAGFEESILFPCACRSPGRKIEIEPRIGGRGREQPAPGGKYTGAPRSRKRPDCLSLDEHGPRQSLSLAITWPSGYIRIAAVCNLFRRDGWLLVAPTLLFLYYLIAWFWIGRSPSPARGRRAL